MRFLLYSHDGMGLGHVRRNLAVATAIAAAEPSAAVLLAHGSEDVALPDLPARVDLLRLPALAKVTNDRYVGRRLPMSGEDLRDVRGAILAAAVEQFRPDVLLTDKHPTGASGELAPALDVLHRAGGRAALGLRDILDDPAAVRRDWADHAVADAIAVHHDLVLVYGCRQVYDPVREYGLPGVVADRVRYCGYVGRDSSAAVPVAGPNDGERPLVVATTGGGQDGVEVLEAFCRASAGAPWTGLAVSGPLSDAADRRRVAELANRCGVVCHPFVPDVAELLDRAAAVVCMAGYNTLVEALSRGVPTVSVPRVAPRTEQLLRATALADRGLLTMVHPRELGPQVLRLAVGAALCRSRVELTARARAVLGLGGAATAAAHLAALAGGRQPAVVGRSEAS